MCSAWPEREERLVLLASPFWSLTLRVTLYGLSAVLKKKYYKAEQRRQDAVPELLLIAVLKEG